jgi:uncharacterized membrane protein SpoIIM required for sporulation
MTRGFLLAIAIVAMGVTIGYNVAARTGAEAYKQEVYSTIERQKSQLPFVARREFRTILINNCRMVASIELGFITFGVFGGFVLFINGIQVGMLYRTALAAGIYWKLWLFHVIPHGMAEYTGFLLAEAAAIQGGRYLWTRLSNQTIMPAWRKIILVALACYPIILLAALIEVYVTPIV